MKELIFAFLLIGYPLKISSQDFVFSLSQDLNSDNKADSIKVENTKNNYYEFKLTVNGKEVIGKFDDGVTDGFQIIDINGQA